MSLYHRFLQIQAYKHDGSFHRLWSHGLVVRDDEDFIVEVSSRVRVVESNNHVWHTREKAVFIFFKKKWLNVIATKQDNGIKFYINIASPAIVENNYIKFIDYDLDLKVFPDGFTKVLDKNEFKMHCKEFGYSEELQLILKHELDQASEFVTTRTPPFNDEIINAYFDDYDKFVQNQINKDRQKFNNKN